MAKFAIPAQEISENLEKLLYFCVLIKEINLYPFVDIFRLQLTKIITQSRKFKQFPYNRIKIDYILYNGKTTCIFFSVELTISRIFINNTLLQ